MILNILPAVNASISSPPKRLGHTGPQIVPIKVPINNNVKNYAVGGQVIDRNGLVEENNISTCNL